MTTHKKNKHTGAIHRVSYLLLSCMLVFGLSLMGCEGPQGPQGERGPQGEQGGQGQQGEQGTADVLYSSWLDIDWNETDVDTFKRMAIPESRITDEFLDTGVVKMYLKTEGGDEEGAYRQVLALPVVLADLNSSLHFSAITSTGAPPADVPSGFTGLFLYNEPLDGNVFPFEGDYQIRYVLIPGSEQLKAKDGPVDLDNYQQVKRYFGIPE